MADIHARVDDGLLEAARTATGLPEDASGPRIVRASLATVAEWPLEVPALAPYVLGAGPGTEAADG